MDKNICNNCGYTNNKSKPSKDSQVTKRDVKNKENLSKLKSYQYSEEERKLLDKNIKFYKSLDSGNRTPETEEQKHFVEVCKGRKKPRSIHERAYIKYKQAKTHKFNSTDSS